MTEDLTKILKFLHQAEKLKNVMRHSWTSTGRRESVAEHTWRMALMAIVLAPKLKQKINLEHTLKMILIHDLVEINYADYPAFKKIPANKHEMEEKSLAKLVKLLPSAEAHQITKLWLEYEACQTDEAKFAKFLDKTEVLLQHDEASLKHLTKEEYPFNLVHGLEYSLHDETLKEFRELINKETLELYRKNNVKEELYKISDNN